MDSDVPIQLDITIQEVETSLKLGLLGLPVRPISYNQPFLDSIVRTDTLDDVPLSGGFTYSSGFRNVERDLVVGGVRPSFRSQLDSINYGQRTDRGANFLGINVKIPSALASVIRTHTSAKLVFLYRNSPAGPSRDLYGRLLDIIHPGHTSSIDAEIIPGGNVMVDEGGISSVGGEWNESFDDFRAFYGMRDQESKLMGSPAGGGVLSDLPLRSTFSGKVYGVPNMARSKNAKRRRSAVRNASGRRFGDWIVGGTAVNAAGAQTISSGNGPTTWGSNGVNTTTGLLPGSPFAWQAMVIQPAVAGFGTPGTPGVGRAIVRQIQGKISFEAPSVAGTYSVAVGIHKSKCTAAGTWEIADPASSIGAQRDDWLYLDTVTFTAPTAAAEVGILSVDFMLAIADPVDIGGGEALHVVAAVQQSPSSGTATLSATANFRTLVEKVA